MKFTVVKEPIPYLLIDDTYSIEEQKRIYKELDYLHPKLKGPEKTVSAILNGEMKKNTGIFLNDIFRENNSSDIFQVNRKLFSKPVFDALITAHSAYGLYHSVNEDFTLVSYYDQGGSYFRHNDRAVITVITWFFKEPKNFTGGDFKFSDYNINVEVKNNRSIIFFSSYAHEVSEVNLIKKDVPVSGRFAVSQFCRII